MVESYKNIGGFLTASSAEQLLEKTDMIKIIRRNQKITACSCYKLSKNNRKLICGATDGSEQGKKDLYTIISEDINRFERGAISEVSGALEHIYVNKFNATKIPNTKVSEIIGKEIIPDDDGYHYVRKIGGVFVKKNIGR
jgi:hypothetical protein